MKAVILLIFFAVSSIHQASSLDGDDAWREFKIKFNRHYHPQEEDKRREIFIGNHRRIEEHNKNGHSWTLAHNEFSDKSETEMLSLLPASMPYRESRTDPPVNHEEEHNRMIATIREVPKAVDYRKHNCMGSVRNQGGCGSCWAYGATVPLEWAACQKFGQPVDLSEQQLVDCDYLDGGCHGGSATNAWTYLMKSDGMVTEKSYPYQADVGECKQCSAVSSSEVLIKPKGWGWAYRGSTPNATEILQNFLAYGPLSISMRVSGSAWNTFAFADGGVYDPENDCEDGTGHAMAIVGYGTDEASGKDYWIIRNSWGAGWGDNGYMKVRRGIDRCGVEYSAAYVYL